MAAIKSERRTRAAASSALRLFASQFETSTPLAATATFTAGRSPSLLQDFQSKRDALSAADAERHDPPLQSVAPHRMQEARREHRP